MSNYIRDPHKVVGANERLQLINLALELDPRIEDFHTAVAHKAIADARRIFLAAAQELKDAA